MPLSYMTPDISSPAVSDDVIIMFLNAGQGAECQTVGLCIGVFLVWCHFRADFSGHRLVGWLMSSPLCQ